MLRDPTELWHPESQFNGDEFGYESVIDDMELWVTRMARYCLG